MHMGHLNFARDVEPGGRGSPSVVGSASQRSVASCSDVLCATMKLMPITTPRSTCITLSTRSGTGSRGSNEAVDESSTPSAATGRRGEACGGQSQYCMPDPQADEPARNVVGLSWVQRGHVPV